MEQPAGGVAERVLEFLAEYGERGYAVLRAAVEAALSRRQRGVRLGDFNAREVAQRLKSWGIEYNPSMLLRILERDYGVVETSYRSSNQHWYKFVDLDAVVDALDAYDRGVDVAAEDEPGVEEDPEVSVLLAQVASLDPQGLVEELRRLAAKPRLSRSDVLRLRRLAFEELELAAKLVRRAEELGYDGPEVELLQEAIRLAARLARRSLAAGLRLASARRSEAALARLGGKQGLSDDA